MSRMRGWGRGAGAVVAVLVLTAGSCQVPDVTASAAPETVGRQGQFEFTDGVVERQVRVAIPPGALVGTTGAEITVATSTLTEAPISAVEFEVGSPAEGRTVVDEQGQAGADLDWDLPQGCDDGCEVVIPVTIRHIGAGDAPRIGWAPEVTVLYADLSDIPPVADDIKVSIEALDSDGS